MVSFQHSIFFGAKFANFPSLKKRSYRLRSYDAPYMESSLHSPRGFCGGLSLKVQNLLLERDILIFRPSSLEFAYGKLFWSARRSRNERRKKQHNASWTNWLLFLRKNSKMYKLQSVLFKTIKFCSA